MKSAWSLGLGQWQVGKWSRLGARSRGSKTRRAPAWEARGRKGSVVAAASEYVDILPAEETALMKQLGDLRPQGAGPVLGPGGSKMNHTWSLCPVNKAFFGG